MFFRLGSLDIWPHRKTLIENMPESYKKDFPNTIVIIDCTELKVHKPSSLHRQSQSSKTKLQQNLRGHYSNSFKNIQLTLQDWHSSNTSQQLNIHSAIHHLL